MEWIMWAIVSVLSFAIIIGTALLAGALTEERESWYDRTLDRIWKDTKNDQD